MCSYPTCIRRPIRGSPSSIAIRFGAEILELCFMLSGSEKSLTKRLAASTPYRRVIDRRTPPPRGKNVAVYPISTDMDSFALF